jgi:hypothetical protein
LTTLLGWLNKENKKPNFVTVGAVVRGRFSRLRRGAVGKAAAAVRNHCSSIKWKLDDVRPVAGAKFGWR